MAAPFEPNNCAKNLESRYQYQDTFNKKTYPLFIELALLKEKEFPHETLHPDFLYKIAEAYGPESYSKKIAADKTVSLKDKILVQLREHPYSSAQSLKNILNDSHSRLVEKKLAYDLMIHLNVISGDFPQNVIRELFALFKETHQSVLDFARSAPDTARSESYETTAHLAVQMLQSMRLLNFQENPAFILDLFEHLELSLKTKEEVDHEKENLKTLFTLTEEIEKDLFSQLMFLTQKYFLTENDLSKIFIQNWLKYLEMIAKNSAYFSAYKIEALDVLSLVFGAASKEERDLLIESALRLQILAINSIQQYVQNINNHELIDLNLTLTPTEHEKKMLADLNLLRLTHKILIKMSSSAEVSQRIYNQILELTQSISKHPLNSPVLILIHHLFKTIAYSQPVNAQKQEFAALQALSALTNEAYLIQKEQKRLNDANYLLPDERLAREETLKQYSRLTEMTLLDVIRSIQQANQPASPLRNQVLHYLIIRGSKTFPYPRVLQAAHGLVEFDR